MTKLADFQMLSLVLALAAAPASADPLFTSPRQTANMLMNIFYQNPNASSLPPYDVVNQGEMPGYGKISNEATGGMNSYVTDVAAARQAQYYAKQCTMRGPTRPQCIDICKAPPTYIWDAAGTYTQKDGGIEFNPFQNRERTEKNSHHPGLDCSGFIYASFAMAGLKVDPENPINEVAYENANARSYMTNIKCFEPVALKGKSFLRPGDLIAWKSHIVMVDNPGRDPFGVEGFTSIDQCNADNIDPKKFTLVVINSKGGMDPVTDETYKKQTNPYVQARMKESMDASSKLTGVGIGISKVKFGDFALSGPNKFLDLAVAACKAKFGETGDTTDIKVVRHKIMAQQMRGQKIDPNDPCIAKPSERVRVKGAECLSTSSARQDHQGMEGSTR